MARKLSENGPNTSPRAITLHKLLVGTSYSEYKYIRGCSWSLSKMNDIDLLFPHHGSRNSPKMASNTSCRAITHHKLLVGTSYSEHWCIRGYSWTLSKISDFDLLFSGHMAKKQSPNGPGPIDSNRHAITRPKLLPVTSC